MTLGRNFHIPDRLHNARRKLATELTTYKNRLINNTPVIRRRITQGFKKLSNKLKILRNIKIAIIVSGIILITPIIHFGINEGLEQHPTTFVVGIMTASAAILAVGIAVLQMSLADISKSYSAEVQKILLSKTYTNLSFGLLISTLATSSLLIIMPDEHIEIFLRVVTILFQVSLIVFTIGLNSMTKLRNPVSNIDFMHEKILEGIHQDGNRA